MKLILSRKVLFMIVLVVILSLASLSVFAETPLGIELTERIYLPLVTSSTVVCSGTVPC
jgi:hypothetical protein